MDNTTQKRQYRQMSDQTKQKISMAMKGRSKSFTHKENISQGMRDYWKQIPNKPVTSESSSISSIPTSQSDKMLRNGVTTKTNPRNNDKIR